MLMFLQNKRLSVSFVRQKNLNLQLNIAYKALVLTVYKILITQE